MSFYSRSMREHAFRERACESSQRDWRTPELSGFQLDDGDCDSPALLGAFSTQNLEHPTAN